MTIRICCLFYLLLFISMFPGKIRADSILEQNSYSDEINSSINKKKIKHVFDEGLLFGTFTKDDGPFLVYGNIVVPYGEYLELGPGCTIYVSGKKSSLTVYGQIRIMGTSQEPVEFISLNDQPSPSDWNQIYCRSRDNAIFSHCIIRHSTHGICIENGLASITDCQFKNNALHGMVIKNSEVTIKNSVFEEGQETAIHLMSGSQLIADSTRLENNSTAIVCNNNSILKCNAGRIAFNSCGIIAEEKSSVTFVGTDITKNKTGLLSTVHIPHRKRETVFSNAFDFKLVSDDKKELYFNDSMSIPVIAVTLNQISYPVSAKLIPGFSALNQQQEAEAGFVGNVTTGLSYFVPKSLNHPNEDTVRIQTHYPDKIQPDIQVFASGKKGGADVNLLVDLYGNKWLSTKNYISKNMFNLALNYSNQSLTIGDFFENSSETSISGRQITGLKYTGQLSEMGGGVKRFDYKLAAGESEIPKDTGDHEINIYNEVVDSGMSVRQQLTYLAVFNVKPVKNATISIKGIIARDQVDKPLFRDPISDPGAPAPIEAQTGCIDGSVSLFKGKLDLFAELDLGSHDSLIDSDIEKIAWYNPDFKHVIPDVFSLFNRTDFPLHHALSGGAKTNVKGFDLKLKGFQISKDYFSAGNPYLEKDKNSLNFTVEKQFKENLSAVAQYDYEKRAISENPTTTNSIQIHGEYNLGENKPHFLSDITSRFEKTRLSERVVTTDTSYSSAYNDISSVNTFSIEGRQTFNNGLGYTLRYILLLDKDLSDHANKSFDKIGDRVQNQFAGSFSFKIKKFLRDKINIRIASKEENRDSLSGFSYKISNMATLNVIPRKLSFTLNGEYSNKKELQYSSETIAWEDPVYTKFYGVDCEAKYSITSRISAALKGRYEKSYDESIGSTENYKATIIGLHLTYLF